MKTDHRRLSKNLWVLGLAAFAAFVPQNAFALSAVVSQIQGEVLVQKAGAADAWDTITQETTLQSGDSVKTRMGSCVLVYSDQATFSVDQNTSLMLEERSDAQDIKLLLGKIKGKVNKQRAEQPFVVSTPAAVATVRGTDVDFSYNDQGQLTVDLHNGQIQVVNEDAQMQLDLDGKKSITIQYDKEANLLRVRNECGSDGAVKFNVLGAEYSENPCEEKEVDLSTSEQGTTIPDIDNSPERLENLDEGREPISPNGA